MIIHSSMDEQNTGPATYQIVYVYEIQENIDRLEGHGAYQTVGYVNAESLAHDISHHNPANPKKVIKRAAIYLPDGLYYLLLDSNPIHIDSTLEDAERAVALSKLTFEERQLLGLE